ncbi:transcriptional regulator, BadM/Rrf2 family [Caminicella sporogenes DSM 14501]|uniref:Transcriptional regulator, BadM/Rrf2 family n=1 Tax=Caminicella sporogenes DSM 14501 TaxID=1121266 RepID=A0A1M6LRL9_9FIRM|nr:Rrf2 family transcriptional regulator [Caminicella sporogenes]RKD27925.1 Rrf2 family transcriptional regulator [Caminicella sporogenes]WIF94484.1 Rrf2 family transcriptional regulator [Caminicella sporogenes]SHJ73813.1 transcriptional regulator, BadM/Rrf2 family [Caminicella sporogenes DSM 14501]
MKLSTKGRYGLKAMLELALNYGEGPIALNSIAERQNLSVHYLEQLIASLRKAGLVKSVRGAQGGYMLADKPENITVGDVIRTLEGPIAPAECVIEDDNNDCSKADYCVTRIIWEKIKVSIDEVIDSITLQNMVDDYKKINDSNSYMYYI